MKRILVVFAHPALQHSFANKALIEAIQGYDSITVHDLYAVYPDSFIDVDQEQSLLLDHDVVVFQHPFYWYSCPGLLKDWIDLVLEEGFAYGAQGVALRGKPWLSVLTTGGSQNSYQIGGYNGFSIREFLRPFEQTAAICGMPFLPPFVIDSVNDPQTREQIPQLSSRYRDLLIALREDDLAQAELDDVLYSNQLALDD